MSETQQVEFLKASIKKLKKENQKLKFLLEYQKEIAQAIKDAVIAYPPPKNYPTIKTKKSNKRTVACLALGDWHIGEIIRPNETEGFGKYNSTIAKERLDSILVSFIKWINVQRKVYNIQECCVFGLGDYISGGIHQELLMNQEFPPIEQAIHAGKLLSDVLYQLSNYFNKVCFYGLSSDNHGRTFQKPIYKQKGLTNYSHVTLQIAKLGLANNKKIDFNEILAISKSVKVGGKQILITHGDCIRGWMGVPYYGIERLKGREYIRRATRNEKFDYILMGHWHVPSLLSGNVLINGALSGPSEFDYANGRISEPCQVAFLMHSEHGLFNLVWLFPQF